MCTEEEARHIIGAEGAAALVEAIYGGWADYRALGQALSPRARANVVHDLIFARAEASLAAFEGVQREVVRQTEGLLLQRRIFLRVKKLDRNLRTRNFATPTQEFNAVLGHFEGMPASVSTISCGYVLDSTQSEVCMVAAVREVARRTEWYIDLDELAGGMYEPASPILPVGPVSPTLPAIRRSAPAEAGGDQA